MLGNPNDVTANELRALACAVFRMLQRAFPFEDCPAGVIVLRHLREDRAEIDLAITERTEPARAFDPVAITAVDARLAGRTKLRVLHVEDLDALVIDIDEREVIELLQYVVTWIEQNVRAALSARSVQTLKKTLERHTVVQIFTRMQFVRDVHADFVERIENRCPAARQFIEGLLDETCRTLRPRVHIRPCECAGKRHMRVEPEPS